MNKKNFICTLLLTVLFFSGCSNKVVNKKGENSVTINVTQELNTIDPSLSVDASSNIVLNNVYEGLYRLNDNNQAIPAGAKSMPKISKDGTVYLIELNDQARWSNGDKVTAEDYVFAWKRAIDSPDASQNNYLFSNLKNGTDILKKDKNSNELGISCTDSHTLQIELEQPMPYFTTMLAMPVFFPLNQTYVESKGDKFASTSEMAIYNGPFVLEDFDGAGISSGWKYSKNQEYWDKETVKLDTINIELVKETATNVNLFENRQVDEVNILGEYAKNKINDPSFVKEKTNQTVFLGYNQTKELFRNKKIRTAISLVIDREQLTSSVLGNGADPATGLIFEDLAINPITSKDFSKENQPFLKTDLKEAKKLWLEGKEELGLAEKEDIPIQLITYENEDMSKVAEYLQGVIHENLEGAKVSINPYPVSVFMETARKQSFDMYLVSWGADYSDPNALLELFSSDNANNWGKYNSIKYDQLLLKAKENSLTPEKRWDNLLEAEKILMEEQGITPIYYSNQTYLRNSKLKNIIYHNVGPRFEYKTAELLN